MTTAPQNLERIEQGGTHGLDITFLNRAASLGGTPIAPDSYDSGDPGASVSAEILVYDNTSGDPLDPANWSTPAGALNAPTISGLVDGGSTGRVIATTVANVASKLSTALLADDGLRWGIHWDTTINGVAVEFFEFFEIVAVGGASYGGGLICSVADLRSHSGFSNTRDISDDDAELMLQRAQAEFLHDLATKHHALVLEAAPADTTLTKWRVPDSVEGWLFPDAFGDLEDATTVTASFLDEDNDLTSVAITSKDSARNIITLASAAPSTDLVVIYGWLSSAQEPDFQLSCEAVKSLATAYIDIRAQAPGSISLADPAGGRQLAGLKDTTHYREYRRILTRLQRNTGAGIGAASIDGRLGRRRGIL